MHEIIIAGFGGQGVLVLGQVLAYMGMIEGKQVSWYPSYGPEQRGGTCNCSVVISENEIGSPIVSNPSAIIAMNLPSLQKFAKQLRPNGLLIYNSSLIPSIKLNSCIHHIGVPANDIANKLGNSRTANMVMLGALLKKTKAVKIKFIQHALENILPKRYHELIDLNMQAFELGREYQ